MLSLCSCSVAPLRRRRETLDAQQRVLEPRARDDQIADQAHQIVEAREIDADEIRPARSVHRERPLARSPRGLRRRRLCRSDRLRLRDQLGLDAVVAPRRERLAVVSDDLKVERDAAAA